MCNQQEVGVLKGLNYDGNIVQFYGACLREGADPMLVTEYMEGVRPIANRALLCLMQSNCSADEL